MENCLFAKNKVRKRFDLKFKDNLLEFVQFVERKMLTKKEKVLIQPFVIQNYKNHRQKVFITSNQNYFKKSNN